jgi:hypothetical protein
MKKLLSALFIVIIFSGSAAFGQSFDWNLRGGLNLMKAHGTHKDPAVLYHLGAQAGVRIASFGFYGEALYSMNENQYGGSSVAYFIPSLLGKIFWQKHMFMELGGSMLSKIGDSGVADDILNPDGDLFMLVGFGAHFSKVQLSLRGIMKPSTSYGVIQLTAAVKF